VDKSFAALAELSESPQKQNPREPCRAAGVFVSTLERATTVFATLLIVNSGRRVKVQSAQDIRNMLYECACL
jgi:hypothetical protein